MLVLSPVWRTQVQMTGDLYVVFQLIEHLIDRPDDVRDDSSISTNLRLVEPDHYQLQFVIEFECHLDIQSVATAVLKLDIEAF